MRHPGLRSLHGLTNRQEACGVPAAGTGEIFDGVGIGVITAAGVLIDSGVCVAGGSVPSCFDVHPEQTTNSTQMKKMKVPVMIFLFMIKNG